MQQGAENSCRTFEGPADLEHQNAARTLLERLTGCAILNMPKFCAYDWQFIDRISGDCLGLGEYKCRSNIKIGSAIVQDYGMWASVNKCAEMKRAAIELQRTDTKVPEHEVPEPVLNRSRAGPEPVATLFYFWELYEGIYFAMAEYFAPEWIKNGYNWSRKDRNDNQITEKMYAVPARYLIHVRDLKKELNLSNL